MGSVDCSITNKTHTNTQANAIMKAYMFKRAAIFLLLLIVTTASAAPYRASASRIKELTVNVAIDVFQLCRSWKLLTDAVPSESEKGSVLGFDVLCDAAEKGFEKQLPGRWSKIMAENSAEARVLLAL